MNIRLMRSGIFILLGVMLLASAFGAQSFTVEKEVIDNRIFSDEVAEFTFTLQNLDVEKDRLTIFTTDPAWNVYFENSLVTLGEKERKSVRVIVDPTTSVAGGNNYAVPIIVKSLDDGEELLLQVDLILDSDAVRNYQPSIFVDATIGEQNVVDPLNIVPVRVRLINKNALDIASLKVDIVSDYISDSFSVPLGPKDEVTKVLSYTIPPQTQPGTNVVTVKLSIDGKPIGVATTFEYTVAESAPPFQRVIVTDTENTEPLFLKSVYEISLMNDGNVASTETLIYPVSWVSGLFTDATPQSSIEKVNGERSYVYAVTLQPGESQTISVVTNSRTFAITVIIIIALVFAVLFCYYFFRDPIIIKKRVIVLGEVTDGVSRLKVILDIKNRTGKLLKNIRVIERAPTITDVEDDFSLGTMSPSKVIKNAVKGTLIRWDFATIEPYEERLITYTIRSKLSILGELKLPSTLVKYERFGHMQTVKETVDKDDDES